MKLQRVKKACQITDQIYSKLIKNFNFKTEIEVANFILKEIEQQGLKKSFPMIVASERNHHHIHHLPKKHKLSGFTIIDFGLKYKGFCSDMTRTIFIGRPKRSDLRLYHLVLQTQKKVIKKIKVGQKYADLDAYARKLLGSRAKFFVHSLGHGLGRNVHQKPGISPNSQDKIRFGDIIAIEPGLYRRNHYGLRIEDVIYVGRQTQILTHSPRKLFVFP